MPRLECLRVRYTLPCDLGVSKELKQISVMVQKIANQGEMNEETSEQLDLILDILEEIRERLS